MRVVIDGIIFELHPWGGVARAYREIIPRMCALEPALQIELLINRKSRYGIPELEQIHFRTLFPPFDRILRPRRWLAPIISRATRTVKQRSTRDVKDAIWHSTFHTSPSGWCGPIVTTVHDLIHERYPESQPGGMNNLIRQQKKQSILEATIVICDSQTTVQDVQTFYGVPEEKLRVIKLGYNPLFHLLAEDQKPPKDKPFLLYVGARDSYKNFSTLLEAYASWKQRQSFRLVVVGRDWSPHERNQLHELNIEDSVHLLSHVDDKILCQLYNQAAVFVYPSLYEGFGLPLLEAAACGCPIVSSEIPSSVEVAGNVPIYFQPTDVEGIHTALEMAIAEGRLSARVRRGLEMVKDYSWDHTAIETLAVYREVSVS